MVTFNKDIYKNCFTWNTFGSGIWLGVELLVFGVGQKELGS